MSTTPPQRSATVKRPLIGPALLLGGILLVLLCIRAIHLTFMAAETSILYFLMVLAVFLILAVRMARRRRSAGAGRELGGVCLGAALSVGISFLAIGFTPIPIAAGLYNIYPSDVAVALLPVTLCGILFCSIFHPLAEYAPE